MSEQQIIHATPEPRTRASLANDLRQLGVVPGMTLIVHSSLRSLGWVNGGPVAIVQALMDAVTEAGTIVMPSHTPEYSDPALWENPPVPQTWWQTIQDTMPAFDPHITPAPFMGRIAEVFRTWPAVLRSNHPIVSFAAWGRHAPYITEGHTLEYALGEGSPLARIYDVDGWVVLLGVGYDSNTSFHLAEYRAPRPEQIILGSPILENGERIWKTYRDIKIDANIFPEIGAKFDQTGLVKVARVGSAQTKLFRQRAGVDFAMQWLTRRRIL